jgi:GR25 family glycosyltransferase involved in LPS biosynthesis
VETISLTAKKHTLNLDWLRAMDEQQLLEHKTMVDQLLSNLPRHPSTRAISPLAITYIAEYYQRTTGFDSALEILNKIEQDGPGEEFYSIKIEFLLQHGRLDELEDYIQQLPIEQTSRPMFSLLCLKYYLSLDQRERAESYLDKLICNHPRARQQLLEAITIATVYDLKFDCDKFSNNIQWAENFLGMESKILGLEEIEMVPLVYCLNLDRSADRMAECSELYGNNLEFRRISAVPGDTLPDYILNTITTNDVLSKGSIGCSLSHISTWETISKNDSSHPPLMVVEDDGLPIFVSRATYGICQKLMMQQNIDLLYIHGAASPIGLAVQDFSPTWKPEILTLEAALDRFQRYNKPLLPGWGSYGYLISSNGARKLLALIERDGLSNHIDWQTFLYSITDLNHPAFQSKAMEVASYKKITGRAPQCELNSGIINFPMIAHIDFSHSTR